MLPQKQADVSPHRWMARPKSTACNMLIKHPAGCKSAIFPIRTSSICAAAATFSASVSFCMNEKRCDCSLSSFRQSMPVSSRRWNRCRRRYIPVRWCGAVVCQYRQKKYGSQVVSAKSEEVLQAKSNAFSAFWILWWWMGEKLIYGNVCSCSGKGIIWIININWQFEYKIHIRMQLN